MSRLPRIILAIGLGTSASVAQTVWYVDCANPVCPGSGTRADPFCAIQDAIVAASDGDVVRVEPCQYFENIDFLGKSIRVVSTAGTQQTTIDGGAAGSVVTFRSGETRDAILKGFTITNGAANLGGGIVCSAASPTIWGNRIWRNDAGSGGGIYCVGSRALILENVISDNTVTGPLQALGGGIACRGAGVEIVGNSIVRNSARSEDSAMGGGVECRCHQGHLVGNTLEGNVARGDEFASGGGIRATGEVTITNNTIASNQVIGISQSLAIGGGITLDTGLVESNLIARNRASFGQGGLSGSARGGGIYTGTSNIVNNMIVANYCGGTCGWSGHGLGGGINSKVFPAGSYPNIVNNTIAWNRVQGCGPYGSASGAGLSVLGGTLSNSIVWGNRPDAMWSGGVVQYCDVEGGFPGKGNIDADPLFVHIGSDDYRIQCTSPAVDAGTDEPIVPLPEFDHSGLDLRRIGRVDMGADEVGTFWRFDGPAVGGQPVTFTANATPGFPAPNVSEVYLSLQDAGESPGIPVPLGGGRRIDLGPSTVLAIWLSLAPYRQVIGLNGCAGASTRPIVLPPGIPPGIELHYAGVSWDLTGPVAASISETASFVTQ